MNRRTVSRHIATPSLTTKALIVVFLVALIQIGVDAKSVKVRTTPKSIATTTSSTSIATTTAKSLLNSNSTLLSIAETNQNARVKRGYHGQGRSYSTGIAYNRINDAGQRRSVGERGHGHEEGGSRRSPVGEDGTHTKDFKSYGVGYEHRHAGHCEESKCGYNIRHCPHGCIFNSFLCGGGAAYDTCCC